MNNKQLIANWKYEEEIAHIHGWDFSHINNRYSEENDLPWDYKTIILEYLNPNDLLLDIDTGGGEFLLSLNHPCYKTSSTEGYPPNVQLYKERLLPLGINFKEAKNYSSLPFEDNSFDVIINRHGNYDPKEIYRLLKKEGIFITEQVGENNDRELVELLLGKQPKPFPGLNLKNQSLIFLNTGFSLLNTQEAFRPIRFYDVGALVWFAHIIEWEFPNFSVDKCLEQLIKAQSLLEKNNFIEGHIHRYLIVAKK